MPNKGTFTLRRLFPKIEDADLARLQERSSVIMLRKGKNLFVGGDSPRSVYAVANGCLKIVRENPEGEAIIVRIVKSGEILGIHEVFAETNYSRTAVALRDSEIFAIDTKEIVELVSRSPLIGMHLIRNFCADITKLERRLESNMFKSARNRVASVLFDLYQTFGDQDAVSFNPPVSRRDVAELADVAPETVSRVLADLKLSGIIEPHGSMFKILNADSFAIEAR